MQSQVILITGASRGLGEALAREFSRRGHRLALVARHEDPLRRVAASLPGETLVLPADVGEEAERILEATLAHFGRLDVLVHNASTLGQLPMPGLRETDWKDAARVLHTNVLAPLHLTQLALPALAERGLVVTLRSDAAVEAYPGWGVYGMSKAALDHQTRTWAAEHPEIAFVAVDPGEMDTKMHRDAVPDADPSGLARPQDVAARLAPYLLSRPSSGRVRAADLVEVAR